MYRIQPKNGKMYILKTTASFNVRGGTMTETDPIFTASPAYGITNQNINNWNNKSDFSGDYNDLSNKPTIPTIPENVSAFNNDAEYTTKTYVDNIVGDIETILTTITTGGGVN